MTSLPFSMVMPVLAAAETLSGMSAGAFSGDTIRFLVVGAILFALGIVGFLTRRNLILMMISAELMLHGVAINFTAFSQLYQNHDGQAFTIFVLTVAGCEAGLGLAIVLGLYQRKKSLDIREWTTLGEGPTPTISVEDLHQAQVLPVTQPRLTPAGLVPKLPTDGGSVGSYAGAVSSGAPKS